MQITFDIETIPSQRPGARDLVRATIKPPATLKKAESIAAWLANEAEASADDAYRKQSLDGGLHGEIISIAAVTDDGRQWARCRTQAEEWGEAVLLGAFGKQVAQWIDEDAKQGGMEAYAASCEPYLVGHNAAFDIGFLWRRCIVRGLRLPFKLPSPAARAGKDYGCTMTMWAGFGQRVSLDALCKTLGVPSPKAEGLDGSQVFDAWQAGRYDEIAAYNLRDAVATAEVWHRLSGGGAVWVG